MNPDLSASRIGGLTIFAFATFAVAIVAIVALDRVGAPGGLVRALGPIFVLLGATIIGVVARNADLGSFLAANRSIRPIYGGLNLTAVAAGLALCLNPGLTTPANPPWLGVLAGITIGAAGFGPLLRRFGATSFSDVVATRFSRAPVRVVSSFAMWSVAALTALAGYETAVAATRTLVTSNRAAAEAIVALALALSVIPGGVAGVIWCGAASAGALAMVIGVGVVAGWRLGMSPPDIHAAAASALPSLSSPRSAAPIIATTVAIAVFFPFESAAIASSDERAAINAGLIGVAFCVTLALMASAALSLFPFEFKAAASTAPVASLIGAAALAASLALARPGVYACSRAFGVALADPRKPFATLASVRLARMRAAQAIVVLCCAFVDSRTLIDARTALTLAMALSLALTAPIIALSAIDRVGPASATLALLASVAVAIAVLRTTAASGPADAATLFEYALAAAAAAFSAGALISIVAPRRGPAPTPPAFDPYGDALAVSRVKVAESSTRRQ
jgi:hypothetical protein